MIVRERGHAPAHVHVVGDGEVKINLRGARVAEQQAFLLARGKAAHLHEPRAATARYDRQLDRMIAELTNGCTFAFPPRLAEGLEAATADQLAEVAILGTGYGLHWEALDTDLSIPWLARGPVRDQSLHGATCRTGDILRLPVVYF